jgi:carboxymethylenebutenolidase
MADTEAPLPLPLPSLKRLALGVTLSEPLSRKGQGPGLIVLVPHSGLSDESTLHIEGCVPSPLMKWCEESYTVVEILEEAFNGGKDPISLAVTELSKSDKCQPKTEIGVIGSS